MKYIFLPYLYWLQHIHINWVKWEELSASQYTQGHSALSISCVKITDLLYHYFGTMAQWQILLTLILYTARKFVPHLELNQLFLL